MLPAGLAPSNSVTLDRRNNNKNSSDGRFRANPHAYARASPALLRCLLVVATAAAGAASAAAQELTTILRYEPLAGLTVTEPDTTASGYVIGSTTLSFTAFGTRFVMVLTSNDALTANLPAEVRQRLGATMFYTGTLRGNADSWIRLTRTATELTGAMWDGEELFVIEQFERVAARVVPGPT